MRNASDVLKRGVSNLLYFHSLFNRPSIEEKTLGSTLRRGIGNRKKKASWSRIVAVVPDEGKYKQLGKKEGGITTLSFAISVCSRRGGVGKACGRGSGVGPILRR